jgi:hypothetical protein
MLRYGLDTRRVKRLIEDKLREDPDIFYYIDNYHLEKLTNLLIEGFATAIEANNRKLADDLLRKLERRS